MCPFLSVVGPLLLLVREELPALCGLGHGSKPPHVVVDLNTKLGKTVILRLKKFFFLLHEMECT